MSYLTYDLSTVSLKIGSIIGSITILWLNIPVLISIHSKNNLIFSSTALWLIQGLVSNLFQEQETNSISLMAVTDLLTTESLENKLQCNLKSGEAF